MKNLLPSFILRIMSGKATRQVSRSRFEFEEDGQIAYLEFEADDLGWITLLHTEVPPSLRGRGIGGILARTALEYARDHHLKVDVVCPVVAGFIEKNPEFKTLIGS
jgi:predicted GNAT family acetyltransferase